jgi:hypothetical protein
LILAVRVSLSDISPAPDSAQISVRPQDTAEVLMALITLMTESDPEAIAFVQSNAFHLQSALGADYAKVKQAVEDCEFDLALAHIQNHQLLVS